MFTALPLEVVTLIIGQIEDLEIIIMVRLLSKEFKQIVDSNMRYWLTISDDTFLDLVRKDNYATLEYLFKVNCIRNVRANNNFALRNATYNGRLKIVRLLLSYLTVDDLMSGGHSSLNLAAEKGYFKIVRLFLERFGAMAVGSYTLYVMSGEGYYKCIKLLLKHSVGAVNSLALSSATCGGHYKIVRLLLHSAAGNINAEYALLYASLRGRIKIVKLLLKHLSAEVIMTDINGAIRSASGNYHTEIVKLLEDYRCNH